jgi:molybdenum cofactor synthesis domain-containing protein
MPRVEALCISDAKGEPKRPVHSAVFRADHGIEGDAHAGPWHRQVSLLAAEDIAAVRERLPDLGPGAFAENVILSGQGLGSLGLGTRIRLGSDVVLTITQIGKLCHSPCRIQRLTGDCIMPKLGLFARVELGGSVHMGDAAEVLELVPRETPQAVVLTISDRCSRGEQEDTAGPAVAARLQEALGAHVYRTEIIPDDQQQIAERLKHYCDGHSIDIVATAGGTGFGPRDVTPEATRSVVERLTPGLDEAMRAASAAKTPHAALSRGVSGIRGATLVLNLPGSRRGAVENLDAVVGALGHGLELLRGAPLDCGRRPRDEDGHA